MKKLCLSFLAILSLVSSVSYGAAAVSAERAPTKKALLIVDMQNDFCRGGSLPVEGADAIVPIINGRISRYDFIIASLDWHPEDHGSFASNYLDAEGKRGKPFTMGILSRKPQMLWPVHCIQGSRGAELHPGLRIPTDTYLQTKGMDPLFDSYSAFKDNGGAETGLMAHLRSQGVTELDVCGLAIDYCVAASALDAKAMNPHLTVRFIEAASRGVKPENIAEKIAEMRAAGIEII